MEWNGPHLVSRRRAGTHDDKRAEKHIIGKSNAQ